MTLTFDLITIYCEVIYWSWATFKDCKPSNLHLTIWHAFIVSGHLDHLPDNFDIIEGHLLVIIPTSLLSNLSVSPSVLINQIRFCIKGHCDLDLWPQCHQGSSTRHSWHPPCQLKITGPSILQWSIRQT